MVKSLTRALDRLKISVHSYRETLMRELSNIITMQITLWKPRILQKNESHFQTCKKEEIRTRKRDS